MWKQYLEPPRARGIRLGSPAPSGSASSKLWLRNFTAACGVDCTMDFLALHWYNTNATAFKEFVTEFHDEFDLNIWVTEWACQNMSGPDDQCTSSEIIAFLEETQTFMDQTVWVERYAWYGVKRDLNGANEDDAMMSPDGVKTDLGRQYISGWHGEHGELPEVGTLGKRLRGGEGSKKEEGKRFCILRQTPESTGREASSQTQKLPG
ncbi:glycosyl hydrolase catalytic core-domain-containing protein [Mycena galericulata]|nr:glycosyl hydrolase catalytic core-domain-containing protein [Mycena galericulata]